MEALGGGGVEGGGLGLRKTGAERMKDTALSSEARFHVGRSK